MPSLLLELHFPGYFTHEVPSGWSLDEGAWSCPRGHPPGGVTHNTPGRHPMSGKLWLGWVASGGTAWRRAGARHTHSSRSPACSSAGPGGTSAGPSCKRPWWWSWKGKGEKKNQLSVFPYRKKKKKKRRNERQTWKSGSIWGRCFPGNQGDPWWEVCRAGGWMPLTLNCMA